MCQSTARLGRLATSRPAENWRLRLSYYLPVIDWHAHHTAPEVAARIVLLGGREPRPDPLDSVDFGKRVAEMDANGIDLQLVSQGAGLNADGWPAGVAMDLVRLSNDAVAERVAPYADRLRGTIAVTYVDPEGSAAEIDRYPDVRVVIRSSGGSVPLLLHKLWWKHKTADGEKRYSDVLREQYLVDCANGDARTLAFLLDSMGEANVVFGSDYCGGLGPLDKAVQVVQDQSQPERVRRILDGNSRRLLGV